VGPDSTCNNDHDFYVAVAATAILVHNCQEIDPGYTEPTELHHILPQQFRPYFESAGFDIDETTAELPQSVHQAAHDVGWNADWATFIEANPRADAGQITGQASQMLWEYGLDKYIINIGPYG
jgi:Predicted lipoprotein of unknown function (DUF2380)